MDHAPLDPDTLLTTTRAVRLRLDFERPVEESLIDECLEIALQAPTASNSQPWHFVVVTGPALRAAIAVHYQRSFADYIRPAAADDDAGARLVRSATHLADRFADVPAYVIPVLRGRPDTQGLASQAAQYGSILQASWSFQLAARARGLGTCFTTLHLRYEQEVAAILGIPHERYAQVGLITVGHTIGDAFRPATRRPLAKVVHRNGW
jgi:nitroreductase